ncbi:MULTISPECIES: MFS transporter [Alphaproteobacteria]|uniref:MFS transporter n=2 Tax=Alphaproteobacteria TaxID=28211 RepID=A0A512HFA0_9HYPH|nr:MULTISPECIES: MFS transporter [Alphaproteobacteria]GEO84107.1 MFS transporter [Ciceribacter naphthalenivorans]GLR24643.1 MFS transporter [Ciceribacter naphthalenivorans]GLT07499.1 MFS transporter [Sphingomonas psychrolutea]
MQTPAIAEDFAPDWAAIAVVILGVTAFSVGQGLTYPLIALVMDSRGVSSSLAGLNASVFAAGLATSTLMITRLTALLRGDRLIVAGLIGASVSLAAFALFDSLAVWFIARYLLGFSTSIIFTVSEAWLNTACPDRLRGRVSGIYGASMCAGFAAGPLAIPFVGTKDGFAFALIAVYVAFVAFASVMLGRFAKTRPEASSAGGLMRFVRAAPILALMVVAFGFSDIAAISTIPLYFVARGYSDNFAALVVTMVALPTALAQPLVGWLLDHASRPLIAVGSALACGASFLLLPFLSSEYALLATVSLLGAASFSLYTCALTLLGDQFRGGLLVSGAAAYGLAYALGSAAGSGATGVIMDLSLNAGPLSVGAIMLLFALAFAIGLRRRAPAA